MISPTSHIGAPSYNPIASSSGNSSSSINPSTNSGSTQALSGSQNATNSPTGNATQNQSNLGGGLPQNGLGSMGALQLITSILALTMSLLLASMKNQQPAFDKTTTPSPTPTSSGKPTGASTTKPSISTPSSGTNKSSTTPAASPAPASSAPLTTGPKNNTSDANQKQRLNTTLSKIAQDPDGAKLLKAAQAKGYTIEVGDPSKSGSQDHDADSVNGVTIPDQKKIIISPNAPDFDKTVAHELVHAATDGDGNSQEEEGMADVVGYRIASHIDGQKEPGSEQQIYQNKIKSYPNLQGSNGIMNSLSQLGIQA